MQHADQPVPRFQNGSFTKSKKGPIEIGLSVGKQDVDRQPTSSTLPSVRFPELIFSSPAYRILNSEEWNLPGSSQPSIRIAVDMKDLSLPSYIACHLDDKATILNCGGSVVSSAMKDGLLAISCLDNQHGCILPHRSSDLHQLTFSSPAYNNVITIYTINEDLSISLVLHIAHHHGYATNMSWLDYSGEDYLGVLACSYVDGSFDILSVSSDGDGFGRKGMSYRYRQFVLHLRQQSNSLLLLISDVMEMLIIQTCTFRHSVFIPLCKIPYC